MQIEQIETFLDLCVTQSFNQTAERLGVTQSTVSGRITSLEKTVGQRLFQRSRSGTALTTEGLRFEPHARSLLHSWVTALNATNDTGIAGVTMRIGMQHDLVGVAIDTLLTNFRAALPDTVFYLEADYSTQMCADLASGALDVAVLYSPRTHPDIHFETLNQATYVMVSTEADRISDVKPDSYILANYAPAFAHTHAAVLPNLTRVSLAIGQNAAMVDLLKSLHGSGYVLRHSAAELVATGLCNYVTDAPRLTQPIFAGVNLRNRHRPPYRKLQGILRDHYASEAVTSKRMRRKTR